MVDLLVRNLSPDVESAIKAYSKETGRSVSEVAQTLIRQGLVKSVQRRGLASEIRSLIHPDDRIDLNIVRDESDRPPLDFS
jgi:plasmid stability protein